MKSFLQKAFSGNLDKAIGAAQKAVPKETMGAIPTISSMVGGGALGYYSGDESAGSFVGGAVAGGIGGFAASKLLGNGRLLAGQKAIMGATEKKGKSFGKQIGGKDPRSIGPMHGPQNDPDKLIGPMHGPENRPMVYPNTKGPIHGPQNAPKLIPETIGPMHGPEPKAMVYPNTKGPMHGPQNQSLVKETIGPMHGPENMPMYGPENIKRSAGKNSFSKGSLLQKATEVGADGSKIFKKSERLLNLKSPHNSSSIQSNAPMNRDSFKPSGKLQSNSSSVVGPGFGKGKLNPKYSRVQKGKKNMPQRQQVNNEPLGKGTEMLETISSNRNRRALFAGGALLSGGAFGQMFGIGERESLASGFNKGRGNTI